MTATVRIARICVMMSRRFCRNSGSVTVPVAGSYESVEVDGTTARIRVRNSGGRTGREVVQVNLAPTEPGPDRPARRLAGFASVEASPGETTEAVVPVPRRAFEVWDEATSSWTFVKSSYEIQVSRSITDRRLTATINV